MRCSIRSQHWRIYNRQLTHTQREREGDLVLPLLHARSDGHKMVSDSMQSMTHHHHTNSHDDSPPPPPTVPAYMTQPEQGTAYDISQRDRSRQKKRNPLLIPLIGVSAFALVMSGLYASTFFDRSSPETTFAEAVQTCEIDEDSSYISVEDEGTSLIMTSRGDESPGASIFDIDCVLQALDVPSSVMNRFETTRALDGTQSGTWDEFEATWNYHPNSGSNITITLVDD